jgi:phenylacetic acid degradation operon negative regulatory protein
MNGVTRPRTLILDIYGAYVRKLGAWLAVSDLVVLMGHLDIDKQSVRSAISRMNQRGLIQKEKRGSVSGYRLADSTLKTMARGDQRIFNPVEPGQLAQGWVLVSFSIPEQVRERRHVIRSRLIWLGFGNVSGGLWIAPAARLPDLLDAAEHDGFARDIDVFEGRYRGGDDVQSLVQRAWDLPSMNELYQAFLDQCQPIREHWRTFSPDEDTRRAFVDYTYCLHRWRKLPFLDPGLPAELLPGDWLGQEASVAFFALRALLEGPANRFVQSTAQSTMSALAFGFTPRASRSARSSAAPAPARSSHVAT